jgi:hypothetical protein
MQRSLRKIVLVGLLLALVPFSAPAQEQETIPEEYREDEFTPFLRDLRRAEIIMLGSFPITLFLSLEVYDLYRFAKSEGATEYTPWPFRPPNAAPYSQRENLAVFLAAVSVSTLIAVADIIIVHAQRRATARKAENEGNSGRSKSSGDSSTKQN